MSIKYKLQLSNFRKEDSSPYSISTVESVEDKLLHDLQDRSLYFRSLSFTHTLLNMTPLFTFTEINIYLKEFAFYRL